MNTANEQSLHAQPEPRPSLSRQYDTLPVQTNTTLRDYGFIEAGAQQGNLFALESNLRKISTGHLVDGTVDQNEELLHKKQVENNLADKESEKNKKENEQAHIHNVLIPDALNEKNKRTQEIDHKKMQMEQGKIESQYSKTRFILFSALTCIIALYLIFFYASAMNAAFFRSMEMLVNSSDTSDISLMLNSIFDARGIFVVSPHLIFVYLGAFLFFGFGLLPHIFNNKSKYATLKIIGAIIICLLIDGLIAYKIDSGIHDLKIMMNLADENWAWYKSVNFYLVLAFGFGVYFLWGFLYEAALKEHEKKNVNAIAEIEIQGLKKDIRAIEKDIIDLKKQVNELQQQIDALILKIAALRKSLDSAMLRPETLLRNMEHFYLGWLQYLNGKSNTESILQSCNDKYNEFRQTILADHPHLN